jgi:chromosome partitioning protein
MDTEPDTDTDTVLRAATYVEKGGVGKTTTAAHIAVAAAQDHGLDVVLLDLAGTQNDLATQFGIEDETADPDAPISAVFGEDWAFIRDNIPNLLDRMTYDTDEGPDLIPADSGLGAADNQLANIEVEKRYDRLGGFISDQVASAYDLVLMDLPGKEDNIALSGLYAAENVVAPLKPGAFERAQLESLERVLAEIRDSDAAAGVTPRLAQVFATMVDRRTTLSEQFVDDLADDYPGVAGDPVPSTQNIGNEQAAGRTLFALDEDELYATGREAREAYRQNTAKLLDDITPR